MKRKLNELLTTSNHKARAIFLDYDGTVYDRKNGVIPSSTVAAIESLRKNNYQVYLCTGRSLPSLKDTGATDKLKLDGWICVNGQEIYDSEFNCIFSVSMNANDNNRIYSEISNRGLALVASTDKGFIWVNPDKTADLSKETLEDLHNNYHTNYTIGSVNERVVYNYSGVTNTTKLSDADLVQLENSLNRESDRFSVCRSHKLYFDINLKQYTKAYAIEQICQQKNIDLTIGIGDENNDIDMLKKVDFAVVMENGSNQMKELADFVTDAVDKDGIRSFTQKLLKQ